MKVTFAGNVVELVGQEVRVGDTIADFTAVHNDLSPFKLSDVKGKKLIVAVPSLDTSVCDAEVRRFNEEATKFPNVTVLTVSMDLPFAQSRWCGAAGVKNVITVSDYKDRSFAHAFGAYLLILRFKFYFLEVINDTEQGNQCGNQKENHTDANRCVFIQGQKGSAIKKGDFATANTTDGQR